MTQFCTATPIAANRPDRPQTPNPSSRTLAWILNSSKAAHRPRGSALEVVADRPTDPIQRHDRVNTELAGGVQYASSAAADPAYGQLLRRSCSCPVQRIWAREPLRPTVIKSGCSQHSTVTRGGN